MNIRTILGFAPLILFGLVGHLVGVGAVGWVALAAAAVGLAVAASSGRSGINPISVASILVLAGLGLAALVGGANAATFVAEDGTGVLALLVGVTMLVTAATVPFTEASARASVPQQYWDSPVFRAVNQRISVGWGIATVGCGLSRFVYVAVLGPNPSHATPMGLLLGYGVPAVLCYLAFLNTTHTSKSARERMSHQQQPAH